MSEMENDPLYALRRMIRGGQELTLSYKRTGRDSICSQSKRGREGNPHIFQQK